MLLLLNHWVNQEQALLVWRSNNLLSKLIFLSNRYFPLIMIFLSVYGP